jgi:hypothetical protein
MDQARQQFRRVNGHLHLPALRAALDQTVAAVTPTKEMPPDHPGPPPNLHGERDNLWQPDISTCRVWRFAPIDVFVRIVACNHGPWSGEGESSRVSLRR